MTHNDWFWSLILIGLLMLAGKMLKARVTLLERLFLPSSIIGGFIALLAGPAVVDLIPASTLTVWRGLPGWLISVVFAALFLGKPVPGPREIWAKAGPQIAFGQTLAWGQYVVGISLALFLLAPVFGTNPLAGALIEIAFEGGHGTAAGMAGTFAELGFPEGADLALALATVGLVSGVLIGTVLINWAARKNIIRPRASTEGGSTPGDDSDALEELKELQGRSGGEDASTDPLAVHLGVVGLAIGIGWLIKQALLWIETATYGGPDGIKLMAYVPLFPLAMLGGVVVQVVVDRTKQGHHISRRLMNRISGTALDFTIVAALGTLSIRAVGAHLGPFLVLAVAGIVWNVGCLIWLAPRIIPHGWFPRGIGDFGQSTGVTVTGILLMRMADPDNESGALESFGYKQLLFEPIVGGGLFTAASMPLMLQFGPVPVLIFTTLLMVGWIAFGLFVFGAKRNRV